MKEVLAVDIGGPIIQRPAHSSLEEYASALPTPYAFTGLSELKKRFEDRIYLISQCAVDLQMVKCNWMKENRFHEQSEIPMDRIFFVRQPHEKAEVCKFVKATHFVEDRAEILNYAVNDVPNLYLFCPNVSEAVRYPEVLKKGKIILNWEMLTTILLS